MYSVQFANDTMSEYNGTVQVWHLGEAQGGGAAAEKDRK